jgi:hypothetical protein
MSICRPLALLSNADLRKNTTLPHIENKHETLLARTLAIHLLSRKDRVVGKIQYTYSLEI